MGVGAAVGEGDELGEGVRAFGPPDEGRVAALALGNQGGGEAGAAERSAQRHVVRLCGPLMQWWMVVTLPQAPKVSYAQTSTPRSRITLGLKGYRDTALRDASKLYLA